MNNYLQVFYFKKLNVVCALIETSGDTNHVCIVCTLYIVSESLLSSVLSPTVQT